MKIKRIGIIGHRKIRSDDIPKIKESLSQWLLKNKERFVKTPELYTSLACGADQLVARFFFINGENMFIQPFKWIQPTWKTYFKKYDHYVVKTKKVTGLIEKYQKNHKPQDTIPDEIFELIKKIRLIRPTWKAFFSEKNLCVEGNKEVNSTLINEYLEKECYNILKDPKDEDLIPDDVFDNIKSIEKDHYQQLVENDAWEFELPSLYQSLITDQLITGAKFKNAPQYNVEVIAEGKEDEAYRDAGRYIADHCDVLLVLWDGVENGKVGGTSDMMEYAKTQECRDNSKVGGPEIHHLVIPQQENPFPVGVPFEFKKVFSPDSDAKGWTFNSKFRNRLTYISLIIIVASLTIVFGLVGTYTKFPKTDEFLERVIYSFALLVLGNFTMEEFSSNSEIAARFCAVLFFILFTGGVAINYLGGELHRWWVANGRYFFLWKWLIVLIWNRHTILVGAGWKGKTLAEEFQRKGKKFLVIEKAGDESTLDWCSKHGIPVVVGDALTEESWSKAGLKHASEIFIFCGDDQVSMECTAVAARTYKKITKKNWIGTILLMVKNIFQKYSKITIKRGYDEGRGISCNVELMTQRNFQVLKNSLPEETQLRLNVLNVEAMTARILVSDYPLDRFEATSDAEFARVVVIGNTSMARAILRQAMQTGIFESFKSLKVDWFVEKPSIVVKRFITRYPIFKECDCLSDGSIIITPSDEWVSTEKILPEIHLHPMTESDDSLLDPKCGIEECLKAPSVKQVVSVYVAIDEGNKSVRVAENIATLLMRISKDEDRATDIQLFCYVGTGIVEYRHDMHRSINKAASDLPIKIFGDFVDNFSEDNVTGKKTDQLAVKLSGMYERLYNDPSCSDEKAWNKSSENDKNSNREAASHADLKVRYYLRSWQMAKDSCSSHRAISTVRELSRMEHRRWCAEYLLRGFRPLVLYPSPLADLLLKLANKLGLVHKDEDKNKIRQWFAGEKNGFKKQKLHLDLMPFEKLKKVIDDAGIPKEKGKTQTKGQKEIHKDHSQVIFVLRYFLN